MQVQQLFDQKSFTLVDNYDWFKDINYLEFLRDVGKHFSMTELVQREYISERMGEGGGGISYAEFSYNLIQGYDFWHLFKTHDIIMQIGGSDQWGNMLSGVPLIRKKESAEAHAMSMPLVINKTTGQKFGKSEAGAVWLDEKRTSVYQFYQFWLNVDDEGVEDYLKIYTLLSKDEIDQVMRDFSEDKGTRSAQKRLAHEVTALVHGNDRATAVAHVSEVLFGGAEYTSLGEAEFSVLRAELPSITASVGDSLIDLLVATSLASSKGEARRFLQDSAVYINGFQFSLDKQSIESDDFIAGHVVLRRGKNMQAIIIRK
jgi:tyrosyl-tRNA synthetase